MMYHTGGSIQALYHFTLAVTLFDLNVDRPDITGWSAHRLRSYAGYRDQEVAHNA